MRFGNNEKLLLLDEQEITLTPDDLVIADDEKPLALAGIMGGMASGVSVQTTDIILEAAFFIPKNICLSKRRHNTSSDSSHRFERGVDFAATDVAIVRATQLIIDIAGGNAEEMINSHTGQIETEHSLNPVPFIAISKEFLGRPQPLTSGILADVAPTVLSLLGLNQPSSMTGRNLLETL